jgi:hypothetical protein
MLPPHIAECTHLDSTPNDSPNVPVHTSRSQRSLIIRARGGEDGRCTSCCRLLVHVTERSAMCSRVARAPSCWDTSVLWCGTEKPTSNASSLAPGPIAEHSSREGEDTVASGHQPMVREKMLVVRGEISTLFAMFMFIILFRYIIILFQTSSNKYHTNNFVIIKQVHFILINFMIIIL